MSWFSTTPNSSAPKTTTDGAYEAPDRSQRDRCWAARDQFFACLDRAGIVDSIKDSEGAERACGLESKQLDISCASSWVSPLPACRGERSGEEAGEEGQMWWDLDVRTGQRRTP